MKKRWPPTKCQDCGNPTAKETRFEVYETKVRQRICHSCGIIFRSVKPFHPVKLIQISFLKGG